MNKLESCIECGSEKLQTKEKEFTFEIKNPGSVKIKQKCLECSNCGKSYFDDKQINQLSEKIIKKTKKL